MKVLKIATILLGAALVCSASAYAKGINKGTIRLADKVSVDGKTLNPGSYTVEWEGTGATVQVSLIQGKQTIATFQAQVTEQAAANSQDAYGSSSEPDGSKTLTTIYIGGKRTVIKLEQQDAHRQTNGSESQ